jgi:hypothetical protein
MKYNFFETPLEVTHIDLIPAFEKSKAILDLLENWDDEGALPYEKTVLIEAVSLVNKLHRSNWPLPKIYHGPRGSIDCLWENSENTFLVNCGKEITFYDQKNDKGSNDFDTLDIMNILLLQNPF